MELHTTNPEILSMTWLSVLTAKELLMRNVMAGINTALYVASRWTGIKIMTVEQLITELKKYPKNLEVFTKKEEIFGNIGCVFGVKQDEHQSFGVFLPCVLIGDFEINEEVEE